MVKRYSYIPTRLKNAAENDYVAGAEDILDDALNKTQEEINGIVLTPSTGIDDRLKTIEQGVTFEGTIQTETNPANVTSGNAKVPTGNAVRGAIDVRTGLFKCTTEGSTAAKAVTATGYVLSRGGGMRVFMEHANTADNATLNINSTGAKALFYNGERAGSDNSWEDEETITVYYDETANSNAGAYFASNAQGGGGKAEKIKYDNSQSGLAAENVQGAVDEIDGRFGRENSMFYGTPTLTARRGYVYGFEIPFVAGKKYKFKLSCDNTDAGTVGIYLYDGPTASGTHVIPVGLISSGESTAEIIYEYNESEYKYLGFWNNRNVNTKIDVEVIECATIDINEINSEVFSIYDKVYFEKGALSSGAEVDADNALRTPFIPIGENVTMYITSLMTLPTADSEFIVYYKDGVFVRSENYGINAVVAVSASNEYNQFRILLYRNAEVTEEQAANTFVTVNPAQSTSNIGNLDKRVKELENNGAVATVEIYANDIAIDLSTEVLNLANESCTNQKFTGTSIANNGNWRLLNDAIPAVAGEYYVVDNSGNCKKFQLAYVNSNGDILKVHGTNEGASANYISNHFIRTLNATGIRIAVNTTSLSGLHLVNGRKFKIVDEAKRNAFNNLCSDGRINVAYMKDASDVNRIVMALKLAGSYGVVFIPSGRYELSSCIWAGLSGQSIEMESDTMLVASDGFTDNYLMEWSFAAVDASDPDFPNPQGESSALANAHITGGVFNAKGLCGCLHLTNFRGFRISGCQFYNAATSAFKVERPGYELVMSDCSARNEYPGLTGNVGFELLCNDCHYHDLISVNYHTGFKATYNPLIARCHPWMGSTDFPTYYTGSIGFDLSGAVGAQVTDCYSDTCQTHYKLGSLTKLIGCVTLSVKSETFPIDEYGDVNLIHNDYDNNVIIGCTFRTSGVTPVRNSGSKTVTEIGCTYNYT